MTNDLSLYNFLTMADKNSPDQNTVHSSFREKLIEHLFIGKLLKLSWKDKGNRRCALEISKPEVDNSGYDLILEMAKCVRHIQLKTTIKDGKAAYQKVNVKLANKPSGCVIWIFFDEHDLTFSKLLFLGSEAVKQLQDPKKYKVAKHTKRNKNGFQAERPNIRKIPKSKFDKVESIEVLYDKLFSTTK